MPILRTRLLFRLRSGKGRRGGGGHRQHTTCRAQLLRSTDCAVHAETWTPWTCHRLRPVAAARTTATTTETGITIHLKWPPTQARGAQRTRPISARSRYIVRIVIIPLHRECCGIHLLVVVSLSPTLGTRKTNIQIKPPSRTHDEPGNPKR